MECIYNVNPGFPKQGEKRWEEGKHKIYAFCKYLHKGSKAQA